MDATTDDQRGCMGFGWIIRDDNGGFKAAKYVPYTRACSPTEAKTMVIWEALSWLKTHNYTHFQIETNVLKVVQGPKSSLLDSPFDLLLLDVKL